MRTGMRGSRGGVQNAFHKMALFGETPDFDNAEDTDGSYDLVIVGAGISGLTAAYLARQKLGPNANILILENDDDFGGHAKRNVFEVGGKTLIGYGGSQSMDQPLMYSNETKELLAALGVEPDRFYRYFDQSYYARRGMGSGLYLNEDRFGTAQMVVNPNAIGFGRLFENTDPDALRAFLLALPLPEADRVSLVRLFVNEENWLEGLSDPEKIDYLRRTSFEQCLTDAFELSQDALTIIRNEHQELWALGWDALSGLEAVRLYYPGTRGLGLAYDEVPGAYEGEEPYIFHFPDGNASIARLLVAKLFPDAVSADGMEGIVTARVAYDRLDKIDQRIRLRLNATVLRARNRGDGGVELAYWEGDKLKKVRAPKAIIAGWGESLPYLIPEMPLEQKAAFKQLPKTPMVYTNVALTNWRAWAEAGVQQIYCPTGFITHAGLDYPVSMGKYRFSEGPDHPIVAHLFHAPNSPGESVRDQMRGGRSNLALASFDQFEDGARHILKGALAPYGFDWEADVAAITVNRWPHGYSYEYSDLADDWSLSTENGPHITARQRIGDIVIAGSDASAYAYMDGAIDAAYRAVGELWPHIG